jgi:hypothetical protein
MEEIDRALDELTLKSLNTERVIIQSTDFCEFFKLLSKYFRQNPADQKWTTGHAETKRKVGDRRFENILKLYEFRT